MSFPRLTLLAIPVALALPLLTGACGVPLAVTAASYGADGISVAATKKTTTDHFASMVTKEDCSFWRIFRHQKMCKPRETDKDPYQVNYDEPFRMQAEGAGVSYGPPLHAAPDAPVVAWDAAAYKPASGPDKPNAPVTAVARSPAAAPGSAVSTQPLEPPPGSQAASPPADKPTQTVAAPVLSRAVAAAPVHSAKTKKKVAKAAKPKKAAPSQVASVH